MIKHREKKVANKKLFWFFILVLFSNLLFASGVQPVKSFQSRKLQPSALLFRNDCQSLLYLSKEGLTPFRYAALYVEKILEARDLLRNFKPFESIEEAVKTLPVKASDLYDLEPIKGNGIGHLHLFSAKKGNPQDKLFVKVPNIVSLQEGGFPLGTRIYADVLNEINWARFLSELRFGPRFYGIYRDAQGRIALVYEYFEGEHLSRFGNHHFKNPQSKEWAIYTLREMREVFTYLAVEVNDLQFRIDDKGTLKVIDTEFFTFLGSSSNPHGNFEAPKTIGYQPYPDSSSVSRGSIDTRKVFDFYINALQKAEVTAF